MKSSTEVDVRAVAASVMFLAGVAGVLTARRRLATAAPAADRSRDRLRIRLWSAVIALSILGLVTAFLR